MLSPFDDYPIHQIAEPIRYVGTSDRNFYDRYYFNAHRRDGDVFVVAGMGQYPNLDVTDAFVAIKIGDVQHVVRASRQLGTDRMDTVVGPFSVEVIEGLKRLRLRCDADEFDVQLDLRWEADMPAIAEPRHTYRNGARIMSDTMRLAQTGTWSGTVRVGDVEFEADPTTWFGGRDRSWGVRPVGEEEPRGIRDAQGPPGFFWIYTTMQFEDFSILVIIHEDRTGRRVLEGALRCPSGAEGVPVPLGRPEHEISFVPGTREIKHVTLRFPDISSQVLIEPLTAVHLALGTGYGIEPDWRHGMYQGPLVTQGRTYDLSDTAVRRRSQGLVDHLARFELEGQVGYGLFEFAMLGPNDRYGT